MQDLLIANARIWTLSDRGAFEGYLTAKDGYITDIQGGKPPHDIKAKTRIDAQGLILMPGLVDCHSHLLEYATLEMHNTQGQAQAMAGIANLLEALKSGIVAVGEHHLGHPDLSQTMDVYQSIARQVPMTVALAFGLCWLGFEPPVLTAATHPGQAFSQDILQNHDYETMATASDFAGENLFLNYTCANAPLEAAPHTGHPTTAESKLKQIIDIFHAEGKPIGAHIEGDETAQMFIRAGGDVIHHGHNVSPATGSLIAENNVSLVITPHAGTSKRPTNPEEAYGFFRQGVSLALASDSYIQPHPEANWISLPPDKMAGPREFLTACAPIMQYFANQGVPLAEVLKLITVNGRKIIQPHQPEGILASGRPADLILCTGLPGIEIDAAGVCMVITGGKIQINKMD